MLSSSRIRLFVVVALANVAPVPEANAHCLASLEPALRGYQSAISDELKSFAEASERGAKELADSLKNQWLSGWDGSKVRLDVLGRLSCSDLPLKIRDSHLDSGERSFVMARALGCRARGLGKRVSHLLESPESAIGVLLALAEFHSALNGVPGVIAPVSGQEGESWANARLRLAARLASSKGWLQAVLSGCPCVSDLRNSALPLSSSQREMLAKVQEVIQAEEARATASDAPAGITAEDRTRMLAQKLQREDEEGQRPARLRPKAELLELIRKAFEQSRSPALGGRFPVGFDWVLTRLELEAHDRKPPFTQSEFDVMRARWNDAIARYRRMAQSPGEPGARRRSVMRSFVAEFFPNYAEGKAGVSSGLSGQGGNCQFGTHAVLGLFSLIPELLAPGQLLSAQDFNDPPHVQAALVSSDPSDHQVIVPVINQAYTQRLAPLFVPSIALYGTLKEYGVPTGLEGPDSLMLRAADPSAKPPIARRAKKKSKEDIKAPPINSQTWGVTTPGSGVSADNPKFARNVLPSLDETPVDRSGQAFDLVRTIPAQRKSARVRMMPGEIENRDVRAMFEKQVLRLTAGLHDRKSIQSLLPVEIRNLIVSCVELVKMGERCEDEPIVKTTFELVDKMATQILADPRRALFLNHAGVLGTLEVWERAKRSGFTDNAFGPDLSDTGAFTPVWDFLMNPAYVEPAQAPGSERNELPPPKPGTVRWETGAKYQMSAETYRWLAIAYVEHRVGKLGERESAFRSLIKSLPLRPGTAQTEGMALVCGDRPYPLLEIGYHVLDVAEYLQQHRNRPSEPSVPCPAGSATQLDGPSEYKRLKSLLDQYNQVQH
jgi:hypothetical protein